MPPIPETPITLSDPKLLSRAHPRTPGDAIVISGVSGKFPISNNVEEYAHNLYNKVSFPFPAFISNSSQHTIVNQLFLFLFSPACKYFSDFG